MNQKNPLKASSPPHLESPQDEQEVYIIPVLIIHGSGNPRSSLKPSAATKDNINNLTRNDDPVKHRKAPKSRGCRQHCWRRWWWLRRESIRSEAIKFTINLWYVCCVLWLRADDLGMSWRISGDGRGRAGKVCEDLEAVKSATTTTNGEGQVVSSTRWWWQSQSSRWAKPQKFNEIAGSS